MQWHNHHYTDTTASGSTAVLSENSSDEDIHNVDQNTNLLPQQQTPEQQTLLLYLDNRT